MKKSLFLFAALLTSGCMVFAQKSNVSKASSALYMDPVNYDEARAAIAEAKVDETTASDPKTWYVAGRIGYTLANNEWNKRYLNQTPDADVLYSGLSEMYNNYIQSDALDGKVLDKKGNPKYTQRKNIKGDFKEMLVVYYATGVTLLQNRSYEKSYEILNDYNLIVDNPMFEAKDKIKIDSTYNEVKYYAGMSAQYAEKFDEALVLYQELIKTDYNHNEEVLENIARIYERQEKNDLYLQCLKQGLEKYPKHDYFIGSIVNYYINSGNYQEAMDYIDQVIDKDPSNTEYVNVKADILIQLKDFTGAKEFISQMLEKERSYTALYLMGKCLTMEGGNIQNNAQDIVDNDLYKKEMARAMDSYNEAAKFFEEAKLTMTPDNGNYERMLQTMKSIYMQTKGASSPEYQSIDAELKTIQ